jgi:hypothetical protein
MPDCGTARADFPGGDAGLLYRSIRRILELPADTRLFTCHDYKAAGRDRTLLWVARSKFYYRPRPESAEKTRVAMAALSGEKTPAEPPNTGTYTADGCCLQMRLAAYRQGRGWHPSPCTRRALSNWKMSSRPPNVRVRPKRPIERMSDFRAPWLGSGPAENHPNQAAAYRAPNDDCEAF